MTQKQRLLSNVLLLAILTPFNTFCMRKEADYGRSALHKAAWNGELQQAMQLLHKDPDPDKMDGDKNTPLHLAINGGHTAMVNLLLHHNANPRAKNVERNTPLHSAARWNEYHIAELLLKRGANPRVENHSRKIPSEIASNFGYEKVARLLYNEAQRINQPILPHHSREAAAIRMMLERTAREKAIATQS